MCHGYREKDTHNAAHFPESVFVIRFTVGNGLRLMWRGSLPQIKQSYQVPTNSVPVPSHKIKIKGPLGGRTENLRFRLRKMHCVTGCDTHVVVQEYAASYILNDASSPIFNLQYFVVVGLLLYVAGDGWIRIKIDSSKSDRVDFTKITRWPTNAMISRHMRWLVLSASSGMKVASEN